MDTINVGTTANDGTGDNFRAAMVKINSNFEEIHRENLIVDGQFNHWYEGAGPFTTSGYTATMWDLNLSGSTVAVNRRSFTVGQTEVSNNPEYYLELDQTVASGSTFRQKQKGVSTHAGKTLTLSFWARGSINTSGQDIAVQYLQSFGSGGSSVTAVSEDFDITTSWVKYTFNISVPSVSGKTIGSGDYWRLSILMPGTTIARLDIANVALVYGDVAYDQAFPTPSEERHRIHPYRRIIGDYANGVEGSNLTLQTYVRQASSGTTNRRLTVTYDDMIGVPVVTLGSANNGTVSAVNVTKTSTRVNGVATLASDTLTFSYIDLDARL